MIGTIEGLCQTLSNTNMLQLQWELKQLKAIEAWALRHCGADFGIGDRVVIAEDFSRDNSWRAYQAALAPGATAVVQHIDFNAYLDGWQAAVTLDREWTESNGGSWWHGRAAETPEGMTPPTAYDQEHYPDGRKHSFALRVEWLRREVIEL